MIWTNKIESGNGVETLSFKYRTDWESEEILFSRLHFLISVLTSFLGVVLQKTTIFRYVVLSTAYKLVHVAVPVCFVHGMIYKVVPFSHGPELEFHAQFPLPTCGSSTPVIVTSSLRAFRIIFSAGMRKYYMRFAIRRRLMIPCRAQLSSACNVCNISTCPWASFVSVVRRSWITDARRN